jgi:hypothetical protein
VVVPCLPAVVTMDAAKVAKAAKAGARTIVQPLAECQRNQGGHSANMSGLHRSCVADDRMKCLYRNDLWRYI